MVPKLLRLLQADAIGQFQVFLPKLLVHKNPIRGPVQRLPSGTSGGLIWVIGTSALSAHRLPSGRRQLWPRKARYAVRDLRVPAQLHAKPRRSHRERRVNRQPSPQLVNLGAHPRNASDPRCRTREAKLASRDQQCWVAHLGRAIDAGAVLRWTIWRDLPGTVVYPPAP